MKARLQTVTIPVDRIDPRRLEAKGHFWYVDIASIDREKKSIISPSRVPTGDAPSRARQRLRAGDVVVSTVRPNLNAVAMIPPELEGAIGSTGFTVLRPDQERLSGRYLLHWVRSTEFISGMVRQAAGASYPAVTDEIVLGSLIPLAPLAEQRRIAAILDKAEDLLAKRRATLELLDELPQAIFLEMFGERGACRGESRSIKLGDLISEGPQNGLYKPAAMYGVGTPILRIDGFYGGQVTNLQGLKRVQATEPEQSLYALHPGDIVINRVNSRPFLGKSALIPELAETTIFESNMMRFSVDAATSDPAYVNAYLQTRQARKQILAACKDAVNQSSINQHDVLGLRLFLPPLGAQRKFAAIVSALKVRRVPLEAALKGSEALLRSLQAVSFGSAK